MQPTARQQIIQIENFFCIEQAALPEDEFLQLVAQLTENEAIHCAFNWLIGKNKLANSTEALEARRQTLAETVGIGKVVNALVTPQDIEQITEAQRAHARKLIRDLFWGPDYRLGLQASKFPYALIDEVNFIADERVARDFVIAALPFPADYLRAYPTLEALASALNRARLAEARQTLLSLLCNDKIINSQLLADTQALTLLLGLLDKPQELIDALRRAESRALVRRLGIDMDEFAMPMQTRVVADGNQIQIIAGQIMAAADDSVQTRIVVAKALQQADNPREYLIAIATQLAQPAPQPLNAGEIVPANVVNPAAVSFEQASLLLHAAFPWIVQATAQVDRNGRAILNGDELVTSEVVVDEEGTIVQPAWHGMAYQHSLLADKAALIAYANQLPPMFAVALLLQPDIFAKHVRGYENFIALNTRLLFLHQIALMRIVTGNDLDLVFPKREKGIHAYLLAAAESTNDAENQQGISWAAASVLIEDLGEPENKEVWGLLLKDVAVMKAIEKINADLLKRMLHAANEHHHSMTTRYCHPERLRSRVIVAAGAGMLNFGILFYRFLTRDRPSRQDYPVHWGPGGRIAYLDREDVILTIAWLASLVILIGLCCRTSTAVNVSHVTNVVRRRDIPRERERVAEATIEELTQELHSRDKSTRKKHERQQKKIDKAESKSGQGSWCSCWSKPNAFVALDERDFEHSQEDDADARNAHVPV